MAAYTASVTGYWDDSATWGGAGVPGDGDTTTINNGVTVTGRDSRTVGDSASPATLAITTASTGGTGVLNWTAGTLTVRGNVQQGNATWTFSAGTGLTFSNTTALTWQIADVSGQTNAKLVFNGTDGSRCTVTSSDSGKGRFTCGSSYTISQMDAAYTDFSNLGDSSNDAIYLNLTAGTGMIFRFANCTFDTCGSVGLVGTAATCVVSFDTVTFSSSQQTYCLRMVATGAKTTGTRLLSNCVFDKSWTGSQSFKDFTIEGNFLGDRANFLVSASLKWTKFANNFLIHHSNSSSIPGDILASNAWNYVHVHTGVGTKTNYHGFAPTAKDNITLEGIIWDPGDTDGSGDVISFPGSETRTYSIAKCLALPNKNGTQVGKFIGAGGMSATSTFSVEHCTGVTNGTGETGIIQWGETTKGRIGACTSMRSNLAFSMPSTTAGMKAQKIATTNGAGTVSATNGSATVTGTGTSFTTAFIAGDWIKFGSETVVYQVQTVDSATQLTLASNYSGTTGSGKTYAPFVKDFIYNAGFTAADYNAGWNLGTGTDLKGYNCELSGATGFTYTPGTNDILLSSDPFVDSTRNIASWAVYKGQASGGDTYQQKVDAAYAYIKASPAVRIADLVDWVKAGWMVRTPALNGAGHDAVTIGALDYQASGSGAVKAVITGMRVL